MYVVCGDCALWVFVCWKFMLEWACYGGTVGIWVLEMLGTRICMPWASLFIWCVYSVSIFWNWCIEYIYKSSYVQKEYVLSIYVCKGLLGDVCWVCVHWVEGSYGVIWEGINYMFRGLCVLAVWVSCSGVLGCVSVKGDVRWILSWKDGSQGLCNWLWAPTTWGVLSESRADPHRGHLAISQLSRVTEVGNVPSSCLDMKQCCSLPAQVWTVMNGSPKECCSLYFMYKYRYMKGNGHNVMYIVFVKKKHNRTFVPFENV